LGLLVKKIDRTIVNKINIKTLPRDAALMAFGSILEGPDPTKLKPLVEQAMPMLIELMKDTSVVVKVQ
jgi:hypothetical protein